MNLIWQGFLENILVFYLCVHHAVKEGRREFAWEKKEGKRFHISITSRKFDLAYLLLHFPMFEVCSMHEFPKSPASFK